MANKSSLNNPPHSFYLEKEIVGTLERITYQNVENGFTVARLSGGQGKEPATVVGYLSGVPVGTSLQLVGVWQRDPRHGWQFKVDSYSVLTPNTIIGMERYLGSGLVKGVGPKFATRIVKQFGLATLEILGNDPARLIEVEGLGRKRIEAIQEAWAEQKDIHQIMVFLQGYGISAAYAVKIFKFYGATALKIVKENPYRLSEDIWGIGFKMADRIAGSVGISVHDPRRARAGLLHVLKEVAGNGHCRMDLADLFEQSIDLLGLARDLLNEQVPGLIIDQKVVVEDGNIYLPQLYSAECGVAQSLRRINQGVPAYGRLDLDKALALAAKKMKIRFDDEQLRALKTALGHRFSVITGGPGTGKSTILRALLIALAPLKLSVELAAPTGRAAKRLAEACGLEARTIHRLLEYDPSIAGFKRNSDNPLNAELIIVDEVSMLDIVLAHGLLRAINAGATLVLVGDSDQLPSVGPGNVLQDIVASGCFEVVKLSRIFRQGEGSLISENAARINAGKALELLPDYKGEKDFYYIFREKPEEIEQEVVSLCAGRLTKKYGFDPRMDIQVLTPMRKGVVGTVSLNASLQSAINCSGVRVAEGKSDFLVGDKVMQVRNNYDKEVFNGDLGYVLGGNDEDQILVDFDGRRIAYEISELNELELAYAVTVHKSQGSEFPCVVLPLHTSHYPLLQRNLLYTGITRGKRLVVLVGSGRALSIAISNDRTVRRNTGLKDRLNKVSGSS
ncbi:MAG: ATP-dependent RecD-like DNA helicase [Proteobacteria bacterium]|nr:ATP-dependent RecD-like DNA helicase [Pseudomonadota bacterium]MBU1716038.1 ATP-dependent RecD-like DNA helicase [Pseudomonadota bacterium]